MKWFHFRFTHPIASDQTTIISVQGSTRDDALASARAIWQSLHGRS